MRPDRHRALEIAADKQGVTLLETLIALFVLLSAFVIILSLFLKSTDYQVNVETKVFSVAFGETVLDDIKVWASDYTNYSGDWSSWNSVTLPEYPGYEARVAVVQPSVPDPCSALEAGKPVPEQVVMNDSFRDLTLVVFHNGGEQTQIHTRLAEPERRIQEIKVEALGGTSIAPNTESNFKATMLDSNNEPVEDIVFRWTLEAVTGNGSVRPQIPDSSVGIVRNAYVGFDGLTRIVPGTCRLVASARYRGREYFGEYEFVEFLP